MAVGRGCSEAAALVVIGRIDDAEDAKEIRLSLIFLFAMGVDNGMGGSSVVGVEDALGILSLLLLGVEFITDIMQS